MSDQYQDIRPYRDNEVEQVLERLGRSPELLAALVRFRYPFTPDWLIGGISAFLGWRLRRHLVSVRSVPEFQEWLREWIATLVQSTTGQVQVTGLDQLGSPRPYLMLSNHRDIAMDPTMINYALMTHVWPTAEIAIGDNLLQNPVLSDVMRLNKAFLVKRSAAMGKREKLTEMQRLSAYIRDTLAQGHSVWLAQREGRAKDSRDHTDKAVLKMLALSGREEGIGFTGALERLEPLPVAVHYEWDPCDVFKARELVARERTGQYEKEAGEDTRSLLAGMKGYKGQVRISFGKPLSVCDMETPEIMAAAVDRQILAMTPVYSNSYAALWILQQKFSMLTELSTRPGTPDQSDVDELMRRCEGEERDIVIRLLKNYAAPLIPVTERSATR